MIQYVIAPWIAAILTAINYGWVAGIIYAITICTLIHPKIPNLKIIDIANYIKRV